MHHQLNRKPSRKLRYPKRMTKRPIVLTRKQRQRRELWEQIFRWILKECNEYRQHAVKTLIAVLVLALVTVILGINTNVKETTQLLLDSLNGLLN